MLDSGLFASRTQLGRRIELLLRSRPRRQGDRRLSVAVSLLAFCALVFSVGAELAPNAEPGKVIVESSKKGGGVHASVLSGDDHSLIVRVEGEVAFNDDQSDVVGISRDGSFTVTESRDGVQRRLRIVPSDDGPLRYHYEIDGESRPFDSNARRWFSRVMRRIHVDNSRDVFFVSRPEIALKDFLVVRDEDGANVEIRVVAPDDVIDVYTHGDDDISLVLRKVVEEGEERGWIRASARVAGRSGDRVVFDLGASGTVRITVEKDADKHELEVKSSDGDDREYIYELNGETRPYDENAKKIFEKYIRILDGGLELKMKGERI